MTQEQLRDATMASARLRFFMKRGRRLSAPDWYEREQLREQLITLGVESPEKDNGKELHQSGD